MLKNAIIVAGLVGSLSTSFAAAQAQRDQPQSQPQSPPQSTVTSRPVVMLTGCLYREDQVPGRTPNVAERAGILEDYILADATIADAQQGKPSSATPTGTSGLTPATGTMYKVENIPDEKLRSLVGKHVQVTGKVDPEGSHAPGRKPGGPAPDKGLGPDTINLPEIEATSIKDITGSCPATPPARK
jgi:hypothetical protein